MALEGARALGERDALAVFEGEAPTVSDAVGEALRVPVADAVSVLEAVALTLWLTLDVLEGLAPAVREAVGELLSGALEKEELRGRGK